VQQAKTAVEDGILLLQAKRGKDPLRELFPRAMVSDAGPRRPECTTDISISVRGGCTDVDMRHQVEISKHVLMYVMRTNAQNGLAWRHVDIGCIGLAFLKNNAQFKCSSAGIGCESPDRGCQKSFSDYRPISIAHDFSRPSSNTWIESAVPGKSAIVDLSSFVGVQVWSSTVLLAFSNAESSRGNSGPGKVISLQILALASLCNVNVDVVHWVASGYIRLSDSLPSVSPGDMSVLRGLLLTIDMQLSRCQRMMSNCR
jgi:hypothetical protein